MAEELPKPSYNTAMVERIIDWVRSHPLPDGRIVPVCIWSERGLGKTVFVRTYCEERGIGFRGYTPAHDQDGSEMAGLPYLEEDIKRTVYARPMWLPQAGDAVEWHEKGVIFIDEINRANPSVLSGLMELLGEGKMEKTGWKLPEGWGFICAANPPNKRYQVRELDEALMNRMLHIAMDFDVVSWAAWAESTNVNEEVISFLARFPSSLAETNAGMPDEVKEQIRATPRTLEYLARLYEPGMDAALLRALAHGLIGPIAGEAFIQHLTASDKPVTPREVFTGVFQDKLGSHISQGRGDLIEASITMVVATMVRYHLERDQRTGELTPSMQAVLRSVVTYIQMLGAQWGRKMLDEVCRQAPHWVEPLEQALGQRIRSTAGAG